MKKSQKSGEQKARKHRGPLTPEQKGAMQAARTVARAQVEAGLKVVGENAQFKNPKFWARVDADLSGEIAKAIGKASKLGRKARVAKLEAELKKAQAELEG
jgi:hypothetical protein